MKKKKVICITLAVIVIACIAGYIIVGQIKKKEAEAAKANIIEIPEGIAVDIGRSYERGQLKKELVGLVKLISINKLDKSNYKEVAALVNSSVNLKKLELNLGSEYELDMKYLSYFNLADKEIDVDIYGYDGRSIQELAEIKQIKKLYISPENWDVSEPDANVLDCNQLSNVKTLELDSLVVNEKSGINTMTGLQKLTMTQCRVNGFGDCSGMDALEKIEMHGVFGEDFTGIANAPKEMEMYIEMSGIEQKAWDSLKASKVTVLTIKNMSIENFEFTEGIDDLKKLNYYFEKECADLSNLQKLEYISLFSDEIKQEHADMLSQLTNIKGIELNGNILIEDYSGIQKLPKIKEVAIYTDYDVPMEALGNMPQLEKLYLAKSKVDNISMLGNLTKLKVLDISETAVSDISVLSNMPELEELYINDTQVSDISALSNLTKIKILEAKSTQINDISALSKLTDLEKVNLYETEINDISALSNAVLMKELSLGGTDVRDITVLKNMMALEVLYIGGTNVNDISVLKNHTQFRILDIDDTKVNDISVLADMSKLVRLYAERTKIENLSVISNLTELEFLYINETNISDLSPLANLNKLEILYISGTKIKDLFPLANLKKLDVVTADDVEVKDWSPVYHVRRINTNQDLYLEKKED
ncbi:leucine-rich repeat domain-containing protein [Roseburia sp. 499]|uniref:leucine-rich repeat domain-containing protein n=1 Tax=Roseburia sp. 499 TaxID=1261634 RepID=UPI00095151D4|nr:leucine-rich repeat domain-containing protein [Roseburia sp. 499]WVK70598.1 leucine-rich repeat domain-containing protein [Roseburia sp. 499]